MDHAAKRKSGRLTTVAFSGCRKTDIDVDLLLSVATELFTPLKHAEWTPIVGDALGVDRCIREHFDLHHSQVYFADWDRLGVSAGPARNQRMIRDADALIALPSATSKGTYDAIKKAVDKGIPILALSARKYARK